jgi:glycosyltransferase involved in cell wall biosynthesis
VRRKKGILVINYSARAVNHLAAAVAEAGALSRYVRPYANQGRRWEKWLARLPAFGGEYGRTFGRRTLPAGLARTDVTEAAVLADMLSAIARKLPVKIGNSLAEHLHWRIQKRLAAVGALHAANAEVVVASYLLAKRAFERTGGKRVLNYPIAHHRYIQRFVAEEAEREPGFASSLPNWRAVPTWVEPQLDAECALADTILVGSSFARDSFIAADVPPEKLRVIPYGADAQRFFPSPEDPTADVQRRGGLRSLFVGQICQRKGISYLLRAYQAFASAGTQLRLVGEILGDPESFAPYRHLFEHIPHVPQQELADIYRQSDVFVFPSLIEGLGLVVLEAMASGLPVITTPNGPGDIVRDGVDGFVVPIRDPEAIIEKLEYLRANPERRIEMGRNARRRALEFTWDAYRQKISNYLLETPIYEGRNFDHIGAT